MPGTMLRGSPEESKHMFFKFIIFKFSRAFHSSEEIQYEPMREWGTVERLCDKASKGLGRDLGAILPSSCMT